MLEGANGATPPGAMSDEELRARFRAYLAVSWPAHLRQDHHRPFRRLRGEVASEWLRKLQRDGWRAPAWPKEFGGMGLSFRQQLVYHEELERAGVARLIDMGEAQLGPTLMQLGTDEQKTTYLPRILDCAHVWCQGYSEPNAGSDLASLRTTARVEGDELVVDGQKTWTTHASDSTHIFTLVRTRTFARKQQGISFLLIDLKTPGITIRPIVNLAGEDEFCEVFLEGVRVPRANLVGKLDDGWSVAKALLGYERIWVGSPALAGKALSLAEALVRARHLDSDQGVMDRLAVLSADLHDYRLLYAEVCDAIVAEDRPPGAEASMLKIYASELLQRITEFNVEVSGEQGGIVGDVSVGDGRGSDATAGELRTDLHWQFMMSRPTTIFAGANEVQRDIARALLGFAS